MYVGWRRYVGRAARYDRVNIAQGPLVHTLTVIRSCPVPPVCRHRSAVENLLV